MLAIMFGLSVIESARADPATNTARHAVRQAKRVIEISSVPGGLPSENRKVGEAAPGSSQNRRLVVNGDKNPRDNAQSNWHQICDDWEVRV
jgi:methylmalonyl-CoA mutase cobalamin-binding subunit